MDMINRGVAIIKPKQPFLAWLGGLPDPMDSSLNELHKDCTAILIPDSLDDIKANRYIQRMHQELFDAELAAWNLNIEDWPPDRDYAMFQTWFEIEFHSLVLDSINAPIQREHYVAT
jgi:hypothetical protein